MNGFELSAHIRTEGDFFFHLMRVRINVLMYESPIENRFQELRFSLSIVKFMLQKIVLIYKLLPINFQCISALYFP